MTRRVLVVEPDPAGRRVMQWALSSAGHVVSAFESLAQARALLDEGQVALALIDEAAGEGQALEEVRLARSLYPKVPVVVTGTLLSQRVLLTLMPLGVAAALLKPFVPGELIETVEAVLRRSASDEGLEYVAALALARHALGRGRPDEARAALGRARAVAPLDRTSLTLASLVEELSGRDSLARQGFAASLALTEDAMDGSLDARAGLRRLDAYGQARPVEALDATWTQAPLWLVSDEAELSGAPPAPGPLVVVLGLGVEGQSEGVYFRQGPGPWSFALVTGHVEGPLAERLASRHGLGLPLPPRSHVRELRRELPDTPARVSPESS